MIMLCWMYCVPFLKGLFFASSPLLIIFALFVLKRGIFQKRLRLRQLSFIYIFIAFLKIFTLDIYFLRDKILCNSYLFDIACNGNGFKFLQLFGLFMVVLSSFIIFNIYRSFINDRNYIYKTEQEAHLRLWANIGISLVIFLMIWLLVPWVGYLTIGTVPDIFLKFSWRGFSLLVFIVLTLGFWKNEDCNEPREKNKSRRYVEKAWVPVDTLWMAVIFLCLTAGFFYISEDVLSKPGVKDSSHITSSIG